VTTTVVWVDHRPPERSTGGHRRLEPRARVTSLVPGRVSLTSSDGGGVVLAWRRWPLVQAARRAGAGGWKTQTLQRDASSGYSYDVAAMVDGAGRAGGLDRDRHRH
jgi:hypothetical protein